MTTEEIYEIYDEIFNGMTFYVDKKNKTQVYAEYKVSYDDNDESKNYYEFLNINDRAFVADVRLAFIAQTGEHYAPSFKTVIQRYADKAIGVSYATALFWLKYSGISYVKVGRTYRVKAEVFEKFTSTEHKND